eukprot:1401768-Rhodomonas_salina.1
MRRIIGFVLVLDTALEVALDTVEEHGLSPCRTLCGHSVPYFADGGQRYRLWQYRTSYGTVIPYAALVPHFA